MRWSSPETVQGFVRSPPNETLLRYAETLKSSPAQLALDLGCGAGRNAVPLARAGWRVIGTDNSAPMLAAAATRPDADDVRDSLEFLHAEMGALPVADGVADLVIAHGIWNLAASGAQFRRAVREAARAAKPGTGLFVFTFSRNTLSPDVTPIAGETFVFTEFAGEPQCFLTSEQLVEELESAGFAADGVVPLRELNRPTGGLRVPSGPVIWEGTFRRR
jgi:ubiquinone/menaquinone biosynthesis C-methylase UbiE